MALTNWTPTKSEADLIAVMSILRTEAGSIPQARDFGLSETVVDQPSTRAAAIVSAEVVEAVAKYAPDVTIATISWTMDLSGRFRPVVRLEND